MAASALVTIRTVTIQTDGTTLVGLDCNVGGADAAGGLVQGDATVLPGDTVNAVNTKIVDAALAALALAGHTLIRRDVLYQSFARG